METHRQQSSAATVLPMSQKKQKWKHFMMNFVPLQEKRNNVLVIGRDFNA